MRWLDIVTILRAVVVGSTPLLVAAAEGRVDCVKLLLAKGAQVNKANNSEIIGAGMVLVSSGFADGATPLFAAAQNGQRECVKLLLDEGAQVDTGTNGDMVKRRYCAHLGASRRAHPSLRRCR